MGKQSFYKSKSYGGIIKCKTSGKYLLVKGFTGKWSFPKGHREPNETPYECAIREIYEETGIKLNDIDDKKAIFVSLYYYFNIEFDEEVETTPLDLNEILDTKWFLPEETEFIEKNKDVNVFFSKLLNKQNNVTIKNNIIDTKKN